MAAQRQGGVIEGKTGSGKTLTSFKLVEALQLKTLFLVNTDVLTTQTMEEVQKVFGIEAGLIKGQTMDIRDFTVGSVQTLVRRDLKSIAKEFGVLIQDECHLASADTFQTVLGSFYAARIYGLSGTPRDGRLPPLMFQAIGPHLTTLSSVRVVPVKIHQVPTPYTPSRIFDPFEKTEHVTELSTDARRNSCIISHLSSTLGGSGKSLILTERVEHAELLYQQLTWTNPHLQVVLYHGQIKPDKHRKAILQTIKHQTPQVTIATYKAIGTGTDVPPWENIYLASPLTSPATLKQAIGRARRVYGNKVNCNVYDYVDPNDPTLTEKAQKRLDVYEDL
jgi:superfamily II DNA or RNA helicase